MADAQGGAHLEGGPRIPVEPEQLGCAGECKTIYGRIIPALSVVGETALSMQLLHYTLKVLHVALTGPHEFNFPMEHIGHIAAGD